MSLAVEQERMKSVSHFHCQLLEQYCQSYATAITAASVGFCYMT